MNDHQDLELFEQYLAGSNTAFGALYRKYHKRVYAFCLRLIRDRTAVDDIVQTVFLKAIESARTLDNPGLFYYWIFTIARNESFAYLRKRKTDLVSLDDDLWDDDTPYDVMRRGETSAIVREAIGRLKPEYRELLILKQYEQLSYHEISLITGDTISSIESRLFKARRALAGLLKPFWEREKS
jgi:RNA polymerase sigma-70 factor, ECF subfamily